MKKILALALFAFLLTDIAAQRYNFDYGVKAGAANYLGDIGGKDQPARPWVMDMKINQTRWSAGAFARYRFNHLFAVNGGLNYARIQGADSLTDYINRRARNLSFRNDLIELSARLEVYPPFLYLADVGYTGRYRTDFQGYVYAGVAGIFTNPKANYQGQWYALQPLMTEGVQYGKIQLGIPMGLGFFFTHNRHHRFGMEFTWVATFTDYLDDVSTVYGRPGEMSNDPMALVLSSRHNELDGYTGPPNSNNFTQPGSVRGNPENNDHYLMIQLSYSYVIRTKGSFYRSNYSWLYGRRGRFTRVKAKF